MEENSTPTMQFNINGPVQILPNATKAEQHIYGDELAREVLRQRATNDFSYTEEENRLAIYIHPQIRNFVCCGLMGWDLIRLVMPMAGIELQIAVDVHSCPLPHDAA